MRDFQTIEKTAYDLIIIGGGINGAAAARDASLRGLKTVLIEKNDFASGSTSWSTRLIHGGLRYLEYFEVNLVRESLHEREVLLHAAPHLAEPIQMTIPIYKSGSRSYWEIQAGMVLYDILSYDKTLPNHRMLPVKKMRQLYRSVNPEALAGAAQYYDAQAEYSERLCWENILATAEAGGTVLNYVAVTDIQRDRDRITSLTCKDQLTGEDFSLKCNEKTIVLNTSGPWVDKVLDLGRKGSDRAPIGNTRKIGGTKGSHIFVEPFPGAPKNAFYVEAKTDNRPFFILPRLGMYLIGTTDERYNGSIDTIKANNDEIDYLINETNLIFPTAHLTRQNVRFTYSGVRPLPYAEGKKPGSISRNHILFNHGKEGVKNLISLIGGKLTTHRRVGEEAVDLVYRYRKQATPPCPTHKQTLPGAILPDDPRIDQALSDYQGRVDIQAVNHLFVVYGAKATQVLALIDEDASLGERIVPHLPDIKAQAVYAVRAEMAYTIEDICRRRTTLSMQANYGLDALPAIVDALKQHCGWSDEKCDRQIAAYRKFMEDNCIPDYVLAAQATERSLQTTAG
ncbi:MAG: glycerol-3-phosphate dehydrogenase/oxidase [Cyanobacteria bacterium P01_A01_bin.123]